MNNYNLACTIKAQNSQENVFYISFEENLEDAEMTSF